MVNKIMKTGAMKWWKMLTCCWCFSVKQVMFTKRSHWQDATTGQQDGQPAVRTPGCKRTLITKVIIIITMWSWREAVGNDWETGHNAWLAGCCWGFPSQPFGTPGTPTTSSPRCTAKPSIDCWRHRFYHHPSGASVPALAKVVNPKATPCDDWNSLQSKCIQVMHHVCYVMLDINHWKETCHENHGRSPCTPNNLQLTPLLITKDSCDPWEG